MDKIKKYIKALTLDGAEMANRTVFEDLLKEINVTLDVDCVIVQDIRSQNNSSDQVDFIISHGSNEIAFVETKRLLDSNHKKVTDILYALDQEFTPIWKHYNKDWMICDYHPNIEYEKFSNSIEVETDDSVLTNILLELAFFYEIIVKSDTRLQDIFLHTFGYKFNTLIFYDKYYKPSHELIQKMINENHTYKKNTNINKQ